MHERKDILYAWNYAVKNSYIVFKLYKDDLSNLNTITLVAIEYTLFDSSHFIHSAFGGSTVKKYAHKQKQTLLDEKLCLTMGLRVIRISSF